MADPNSLRDDLFCAGCGYNLRGRDAGEWCPECGLPVSASVSARTGTSEAARQHAEKILAAAKAAGVSRGAAALVMKSVRHAQLVELSGAATPRELSGVPQVGCAALCDALIEVIEERSRSVNDATRRLRTMGITTCGDVGRVVSALIETGLLTATSPDELGQFDQLRTIETWLGTAARDPAAPANAPMKRATYLLWIIVIAGVALLVWAVWRSRQGR